MADNALLTNSWKNDIKNLFKMMPKIEADVMKQLDTIDNNNHSMFKIDVEDKGKKYEIIIKIK
jgi:hypothetical protein